MSRRDSLLAVAVAVIWGLNFLAVRVALDHYPPFLLAALRYLLVAVPVVLFVAPPKVPLRWLVGYGAGFGVIQFGLLFLAIEVGMPAGLASVALQAGAPFAVLLGAVLLGERMSARGYAGVALAVVGLAVIGVARAQVAAVLPVVLTVLAALGWALGSISSRLARPESPLRFALWMSVVPPLPLLAVSAVMEGPGTGWTAVTTALRPDALPALGGLAFIVVLGTVVSSALWSGLLARHPASTVAPFSMLVPVVGMAAAWVFLDEIPSAASFLGGALVLAGVVIGTLQWRRVGTDAAPTGEPSREPAEEQLVRPGTPGAPGARPGRSPGPR